TTFGQARDYEGRSASRATSAAVPGEERVTSRVAGSNGAHATAYVAEGAGVAGPDAHAEE
ncbi:MAG: hypothetical protein ABW133_13850, partial [Polyangiaceae bacterium]